MKKILYVEDDAINALIMQKLLASHYEVFVVTDGEACLKLIGEKSFDLILMDINLGKGKMDGTETMKQIKASLKTMPVLAVTAYAMPEDEDRFLKLGFDGYVVKPIDRKLLMDYLETFF